MLSIFVALLTENAGVVTRYLSKIKVKLLPETISTSFVPFLKSCVILSLLLLLLDQIFLAILNFFIVPYKASNRFMLFWDEYYR